MNWRDKWMNNTKFGEKVHGNIFKSKLHRNTTSDKLPPRLQRHGLSVAARVFGNEIRNFAMRTTGKDLAQLRHSKTRAAMLTKLSAIKVAVTNKETQYNLLTLACDHSSNLVSSLSPEGPECNYNFKKNNFMHEFIAQYHENCVQDCENKSEIKRHAYKKHKLSSYSYRTIVEKEHSIEKEEIPLCRCNSPVKDEKESEKLGGKYNFLSCWQHKGIKEEELDEFLDENLLHFQQENKNELQLENSSEWSHFLKTDNSVVFRRKIESGLYEYRVQATFHNISANDLFRTQIDGNYRKKWDEYVLELDVVDSDKKCSTELVHWITKCPYPFATREYIYLRRKKIDEDRKMMVLYSKATDQTDIERTKKVERVDTYVSKLIIKSHNDNFDGDGCDFLLTYYDDPKMMLPRSVLDMAASKGINDSMTRMYDAAAGLNSQ